MESIILILKRNEIIFNEGDKSDCMYDIRLGRVGIYANYGTKEEKLLTELTKESYLKPRQRGTRKTNFCGMMVSPGRFMLKMVHLRHMFSWISMSKPEVCTLM